MTIKEIETLSGLPRANIRYYESEGLIAPRVYLKTPNAPGQRTFSRCAAPFFLEIRQYSCEKCLAQRKNFSLPVTLGVFRYTLATSAGRNRNPANCSRVSLVLCIKQAQPAPGHAQKPGRPQRDGPVLIAFVQSTISTLTFWPVRWATDLMIVRISLAMRP